MSTPKKQVRDWYVGEALSSMARLNELLLELTETEVIAALTLESQSRRRRSITDRLISRAVRINELNYSTILKKKFNGSSKQAH